jgi:thioredoxin 1
MSHFKPYLSKTESPSRTDVEALRGLTLIAQALATPTKWQHFKIEDGPGHALGRSYRVKLWPTMVLLRDGQEVGRLVRPAAAQDIESAMSKS